MGLFLSWSKPRSKAIAGALRAWLITFTVALVFAPGCIELGAPPTCFGLKVGNRIAITVVDTYVDPPYVSSYDSGTPGRLRPRL